MSHVRSEIYRPMREPLEKFGESPSGAESLGVWMITH